MAESKLFKSNVLAAGVKTPTDVIDFEFELKEGVTTDQILYIQPDCGACTKAKVVGNKVVGTVDLSKAMPQYNAGKTPITKNVYVYLNDGQPRFIGDETTKVMKANPNKEMERLNIACVVEN